MALVDDFEQLLNDASELLAMKDPEQWTTSERAFARAAAYYEYGFNTGSTYRVTGSTPASALAVIEPRGALGDWATRVGRRRPAGPWEPVELSDLTRESVLEQNRRAYERFAEPFAENHYLNIEGGERR